MSAVEVFTEHHFFLRRHVQMNKHQEQVHCAIRNVYIQLQYVAWNIYWRNLNLGGFFFLQLMATLVLLCSKHHMHVLYLGLFCNTYIVILKYRSIYLAYWVHTFRCWSYDEQIYQHFLCRARILSNKLQSCYVEVFVVIITTEVIKWLSF